MKTIEQINFQSTLLVPMPKYANGNSFRWIDTFKGSGPHANNSVDVIVFNTDEVREIKPLLEKDLQELKGMEPTDQVKNSMSFIEKTMDEIGKSGIEHKVPAGVLKALAHASGKMLKEDEVIYLSGVSGLWEN
jgi:hypothetical protein